MVSPLEPGKTYITILVAGDGIRAESRSDPQSVTTLGKGIDLFIDLNGNWNSIVFRSWSTCCEFSLVHRFINIVNFIIDHFNRRLCFDEQKRWKIHG